MSIVKTASLVSRRRIIALGAGLAAAASQGILPTTASGSSAYAASFGGDGGVSFSPPPEETIKDIEKIVGAQGKVSNQIYSIGLDRNDITDVTLKGVPIKPSFQIGGGLYFQQNADGTVTMNSDMALKAGELDGFIRQLVAHEIVFQAEHQHLYDYTPMVWYIHFRATGDAKRIAKGVKAALSATSTPFPQKSAKQPTTTLPAEEMGKILGAKPTIHEGGVVKFSVPRAEQVVLGGVKVSPYLNIDAPLAFQPHGGGQNAAAVPDFAMIASEINPVVGLMQKQGWDIGCLYNQETDEQPQLYFSHQFKTGDALQLAKEIRAGLNLTNSKFK